MKKILCVMISILCVCGMFGCSKEISAEESMQIAFRESGADTGKIEALYVGCNDGVYEVEFIAQEKAYDYSIDAESSKILSSDTSCEHVKDSAITLPEGSSSVMDALNRAVETAEIGEDEIESIEISIDSEEESFVYEVEIRTEEFQFECSMDAKTQDILERKYEEDADDDEVNAEDVKLSEDEVKEIVSKHSKVAVDKMQNYMALLENENGKIVYEVDFSSDGAVYDYSVDAQTKEILEYEVEFNANKKEENSKQIGTESAKDIAIKTLGLTQKDRENMTCMLEKEATYNKYEVQLRTDSYLYGCEIHAGTGKVIEFECKKL